MRIGLYKLERSKPVGEWIYIVDSSIQMGLMKGLVILGIRRDVLENNKDYTLSHDDLEPIVLKTIETCSGEVVCDALLEAEKKTGTPSAIVSDEGSEIKRGVRLFNAVNNKNVIHLHDIVHLIDNLLKKELKNDALWASFTKEMTNTVQQLKLTKISHFIPPKQRQKKRMLGEFSITKWANNVLRYLDKGYTTVEEETKLGWIRGYRQVMREYREITLICKISIEEVRKRGYYNGLGENIKAKLNKIVLSERARQFFIKVEELLKNEENKLCEQKHFLGSSEIIESLFGKFKQLEKDHASGGLTSLVLSMPAIVGKLSVEMVKIALETVPVMKARKWIEDNIGISFWSKRRMCFEYDNTSKSNFGLYDYLDVDENKECYA